MSSRRREVEKNGVDRRRLLQLLGAGTVGGLAGCMSDDTEGLGERVSNVVVEYWSNFGGTTQIWEDMLPNIKEDVEETLGITLEVVPVELQTQLTNVWQDKRTCHFVGHTLADTPDRIDPFEPLDWFKIENAGANGRSNSMNYASCEFSRHHHLATTASDEDERRDHVIQAQEVMAEDCMPISLLPTLNLGAYRPDTVELRAAGSGGLRRTNPNVFIKSVSTSGDQIVAGVPSGMMSSQNFLATDGRDQEGVWNQQIHSPLIQYDENFNIVNVLAEGYEVVSGDEFVVDIRNDATFHNGDPVTAEDVKFTFEQLARGAEAGVYARATIPPYEEIEAVDDGTVAFRFTEPYLPFIATTMARWGILHKDTFVEAGADENPGDFSWDELVGSGPFRLMNFAQATHMETEPFDDHPVFSPEQGIFWQSYQSEETMVQALQNNEVQMVPELSPGSANRIDEEVEDVEAHFAEGAQLRQILPQHPHVPTKFVEFRRAIAASIDRRTIAQVAFQGNVEPELYATMFPETHPSRAPEDRLYRMADPEGSPDRARQILEDAGWGWDGDDNLHYPEDADLTPLWPAEETPDPDDFPCLEEGY